MDVKSNLSSEEFIHDYRKKKISTMWSAWVLITYWTALVTKVSIQERLEILDHYMMRETKMSEREKYGF